MKKCFKSIIAYIEGNKDCNARLACTGFLPFPLDNEVDKINVDKNRTISARIVSVNLHTILNIEEGPAIFYTIDCSCLSSNCEIENISFVTCDSSEIINWPYIKGNSFLFNYSTSNDIIYIKSHVVISPIEKFDNKILLYKEWKINKNDKLIEIIDQFIHEKVLKYMRDVENDTFTYLSSIKYVISDSYLLIYAFKKHPFTDFLPDYNNPDVYVYDINLGIERDAFFDFDGNLHINDGK